MACGGWRPVSVSSSGSRSRLLQLTLLAPLILYGLALVRTAWLADDAYITFRSVDNLLAGHGPVWNPGERVQTFTHPLWFGVVTAVRGLTGSFHLPVMIVSMILALAGVALAGLTGQAPWWRRALILTLCCLSRSFVDYSTSGLENPLSHLLLAIFALLYIGRAEGQSASLLPLALVGSLGVLNRQDALLIYAPPLMIEFIQRLRFAELARGESPDARPWRVLGNLMVGFLPLILWEGFSVFYYGFPFPNTAYAKLNTGIPRMELLEQGFYYFWRCVEDDPLTIGVIVTGLIAGFTERDGRFRAFATGLALYVAYVVWIGGDFMAGRFFALPFWGAILILLNVSLDPVPVAARWSAGALLAVLAVFSTFALQPAAPLLSGPTYPDRPEDSLYYDWRGIGDERGGYYPWTGLLRAEPERRSPQRHPWTRMGEQLRADPPAVYVQDAVGFIGWSAGDAGTILDPNALGDPLLARLPAIQEPPWRIGHFTRAIPPGYLATLVLGENRIQDPGIAEFYEDLRLITRGSLFSLERLAAIGRLNLQSGPEIGDPEYFRAPPQAPKPARRHYRARRFEPGASPRSLPGGDSFVLYWEEMQNAAGVTLTGDRTIEYDVEVAYDGELLDRDLLRPGATDATRIGARRVEFSEEIMENGYNTVRFFPRVSAGVQRIDSIRLWNGPGAAPADGGSGQGD